jgi:hypothetical protein
LFFSRILNIDCRQTILDYKNEIILINSYRFKPFCYYVRTWIKGGFDP